jgi:hypothetical protein
VSSADTSSPTSGRMMIEPIPRLRPISGCVSSASAQRYPLVEVHQLVGFIRERQKIWGESHEADHFCCNCAA